MGNHPGFSFTNHSFYEKFLDYRVKFHYNIRSYGYFI